MKELKDWNLRTALFLRYGKDDIDPRKPPVDLLSWRVVAKLMKLPYDKILRMKRTFFGEKKKSQ